MKNDSEEKLHKLIQHVIKNKLMNLEEIAKVLNITTVEFVVEYEQDYCKKGK